MVLFIILLFFIYYLLFYSPAVLQGAGECLRMSLEVLGQKPEGEEQHSKQSLGFWGELTSFPTYCCVRKAAGNENICGRLCAVCHLPYVLLIFWSLT